MILICGRGYYFEISITTLRQFGDARIMGLDYHLECKDCIETFDSYQKSSEYEYSTVGYIESKYPDDCVEQVKEWTEFIAKHSGHRIILVDSFGNDTNPAKVKGDYVLGISNKVDGVTYENLNKPNNSTVMQK